MKKAHAEGRAPTWRSRKKCPHSYPELWFIGVIKNEFNDKNYETELSVGRYFLDFAWRDKMLYIEIDGSQHLNEERKASDRKKDEYCQSLGWKGLRLSWSYIINNKQEAIKLAKDFIDSGVVKEIKWQGNAEKKALRDKACEEQGKIDKTGRHQPGMLTENEWAERKSKVINSGVDLMKFGWVSKVMKATGLSKRMIYNVVKRFDLPVYKLDRAVY